MDKRLLTLLVIVGLLLVPTTLMIVSGDLFPKDDDKYSIGIVTGSEGQTIFTRNVVEGVGLASVQYPNIDSSLYVSHIFSDEGFLEAAERAAESGCRLIIAPGYETVASMEVSAGLHPDISYLTVDGPIEEYRDNIANIVFRSNEPSFVAGYVAGMMTETGIVGFLGGIEIPSVTVFYYGFRAGVDKASVERNMSITLLSSYVGSFTEPETGYLMTSEMYERGSDIVFTVAGDSGIGGISAAKDLDRYVIGVDIDQSYLAPTNVIFSVAKRIPTVVSKIVGDYAEGTDYSGSAISIGYAEDGFELSSFTEAVPPSLRMQSEVIAGYIADGSLVVPSTEEEYREWNVYRVPFIA